MPKSIRIDNGKPMGDPQRKSIPALALWLEGKGVQVIFNRPRRPTDNAKVERMQRTTKNWAEVGNCQDIAELTERLKRACFIQRELYKVSRLRNRTRKDVFPQLYNNPRKFNPDGFDIQKTYQRLQGWIFARQVSSIGQFMLYRQVYYLGKAYRKQYISIRFNAATVEWQIFDAQGLLIKALKAEKMDEMSIRNLTVCQRTNKK